MDATLHNCNLLKAKLKSRDEMIRRLKAQIEMDAREYSDRIEELTRERDTLQRERDALQRECDTLRRKNRSLKLDNIQLKSECEEANQELLLASDHSRPIRRAVPGEAYGYDGEDVDTDRMTDKKMSELIERLSPFFKDEALAKRYLNAIRGQKDAEIAMITNNCWEKGAIHKKARKTHLWRVLNEAKLYKAQESNWNAMVDFKKK